jgi:hypothetical protein
VAWLAALDRRTARWSRLSRWSYLFFKWNLVAIGAFLLVMLGVEQLREKRLGIGVAFLVYLTYHGIDAVIRVARGGPLLNRSQ